VYTEKINCTKNITTFVLVQIGIHEQSDYFGRNNNQNVSNQKFFPTSPNLCFCTTWGTVHPEIVVSSKCCFAQAQNSKESPVDSRHSWTTIHCQNDQLYAPDRT